MATKTTTVKTKKTTTIKPYKANTAGLSRWLAQWYGSGRVNSGRRRRYQEGGEIPEYPTPYTYNPYVNQQVEQSQGNPYLENQYSDFLSKPNRKRGWESQYSDFLSANANKVNTAPTNPIAGGLGGTGTPWGTIAGTALTFGHAIGDPVYNKFSETDPNTGRFKNFNKAVIAQRGEAMLDPVANLTNVMGEETATTGDKLLAVGNVILPGLGNIGAKKRMERLEKKSALGMEYQNAMKGLELNPEDTIGYNIPTTAARCGGRLRLQTGGYKGFNSTDDILNEFNGPTHEYGGIDIGPASLVEGGETMNNDYVFSDTLKLGGKTFAQLSKGYKRVADNRKGDSLSEKTLRKKLDILREEQEPLRQEAEMNDYIAQLGGYLKYGGIRIKPSKRGSLHTALGIPQGEKIPVSKLQDKPGDSPEMRKKKNFARNARKWKHDLGGLLRNKYQLGGEEELYPNEDFRRVPYYQFNEEELYKPVIGITGDIKPNFPLSLENQWYGYPEHRRRPVEFETERYDIGDRYKPKGRSMPTWAESGERSPFWPIQMPQFWGTQPKGRYITSEDLMAGDIYDPTKNIPDYGIPTVTGTNITPPPIGTPPPEGRGQGWNNWLMAAGYAGQAAPSIIDILTSGKVDKTTFPRVDVSKVSYEPEREETKKQYNILGRTTKENLRNLARGRGQYMSNLATMTAAQEGQKGAALSKSYMDEINANAQLLNQMRPINAQIEMQEIIANEQNKARREDIRRQATYNIGDISGGITRDVQGVGIQDYFLKHHMKTEDLEMRKEGWYYNTRQKDENNNYVWKGQDGKHYTKNKKGNFIYYSDTLPHK